MVRPTKKELEALSTAIEYFENEGLPLFVNLRSLLNKYNETAKEVAVAGGTPINQIENCLVMYSDGKVIPVTAARNIFWIKQYNLWKSWGVKMEDVETVAKWLATQGWMSPMTIDQVGYKWPSYLARAKAEAGPRSKPAPRKEFEGE